ncbi:MAG: DUF2062 domain-containing protein [Puniceicoccales bacterium]|jgi:uncharacterized protein (DUF2062 family)|nr:DUF2062 domain-containing protein [Puniceicoccales bacterium]
MTEEQDIAAQESQEAEARYRRIKLVKRLLKYVPRRSNLHRYPILKYFANTARQRAYLWSFRVTEAVPALYAGWILTLVPVMSIQIAVACILAFLFRANVMILVALQFVSTPFTVPFLWYIAYKVGAFFVSKLGTEEVQVIKQSYEQVGFEKMSDFFTHGEQCIRWFFTTTLGGIILGMIMGHISAMIYKYFADRYSMKSKESHLAD